MKQISNKIYQVKFGKNVKIIDPVNIYKCEIEDEVFIGPFVEIQANVKIGKKTKIQSHSFICELVTIGKECFIGHGVVFTNDYFPRADNKIWKIKKTIIENGASIGANSTILCGIKIGERSMIAAGSVVINNVNNYELYAGNPAKLKKKIKKND